MDGGQRHYDISLSILSVYFVQSIQGRTLPLHRSQPDSSVPPAAATDDDDAGDAIAAFHATRISHHGPGSDGLLYTGTMHGGLHDL